jgi:hypothetical protein
MNFVANKAQNYYMKGIKYLLMVFLFTSFNFKTDGAERNLLNDEPKNEFKLYPNPVLGDDFTIDSKDEIIEVKMLNLLGQQVYQSSFLQEHTVQIELDTPEKGLYLVQITTKDKRVTTKRILFK